MWSSIRSSALILDIMNKRTDTAPLDLLRFSLDKRAKSGVAALVVAPSETTEFRAQLTIELPDYQMVDIQAEGVAPHSLYRFLKERLTALSVSGNGLAHVWGLEQWLFEEGREGEWRPTRLTEQLNLERELIFRELPCMLLLWLSPIGAIRLAQSAPDFWNWLTIRVDMGRKQSRKAAAPVHVSPLYTPEQLARFEELHQKIKQARQRVHQARKAVAGQELRALRDLDSLKGLLDRALEKM